jgi:Sulfotransferase domain
MPLQVIGAGLGRTGTVSLKLALEQLGFGRCYHMVELIGSGHLGLWKDVADGHPDWETIFAGYGATTDYPGCLFWRELADLYPEAKIILSLRDPDAWFDSTQATVFAPGRFDGNDDTPFAPVMNLIKGLHRNMHDRAAMLADFERHNSAVIEGVPKERLLVCDVSQGWEPLCRFLGVAVPETLFPHANTRVQTAAMLAEAGTAEGSYDEPRMRRMIKERLTRVGVAPPKP